MNPKEQFHFERETEALHSRGTQGNIDDLIQSQIEIQSCKIEVINLRALVTELTEYIESTLIGMPITEVGAEEAHNVTELITRAKSEIKHGK